MWKKITVEDIIMKEKSSVLDETKDCINHLLNFLKNMMKI